MQSQNGDVELSVTLSTKGLESEVQKIKKKIEKGVGGTTKTKPVIDSSTTKQVTQEINKMENALEKAKEQAKSLHTQLEEAKAVKVPTEEYKRAQENVAYFQKELEKVNLQLDRMEMLGDNKTNEPKFAKLAERADKLKVALKNTNDEILRLENSGKAFAQGNIEEVANLQNLYDTATSKVALMLENIEQQEKEHRATFVQGIKQQEAELAQSIQNIIRLGSEEWYALSPKERVSNTLKALQNIIFKNKELKESMQDVSKFGAEGWYNLTPGERIRTMIDYLKTSFTNLGKKAVEFGQNVKNSFASVGQAIGNTIKEMFSSSASLNKLGSIFSKISGSIDNLFKKILSFTKTGFHKGIQKLTNSFKRLAPAVHNTGHAFKLNIVNILGMALGIRGLYGLIGKLKSMISEGIQYLAQYNDGNNDTNKSISMLLTSLNQLKGAWASAFAPILTAVAPILNQLIGLLTNVANAIAQFTAVLTGKSTWMKAIATQQDYAASLGKTGSAAKKADKEADKLKGTLAGFDDLDVLNPKTDTDDLADALSGGAGSAVPVQFEEMDVDPWFKDLVAKLKEMWASADFTELGKAIGEWLKKALDSIPWDIVKEFARKLAKSIATFVNGFIEVEGLGESIGKTIAEAINTAFEFIYEFVRDLHWDSLGEFIGEGILGFVENIDYDLIGSALGAALWGAIQAAFYTVKTFTEGEGWKILSEGITTLINKFVEELGMIDAGSGLTGWEMAGDTAYNIVHGIITSITNVLNEFPTDEVLQGFADFMNRIDFEQIGLDLNQFATVVIGILADTIGDSDNWKLMGEKIAAFLNGVDFVSLGIDLAQLALNILAGIGEGFKSCKSNLNSSNKFVLGMAEAIIAGLLVISGMTKLAGVGLQIFSFLTPALQTSMLKAAAAAAPEIAAAGGYIGAGLVAGIAGYFAGLKLGEILFPDDAQWYREFSWSEIFGSTDELLDAFKLWFQDIWEALPTAIRLIITVSNPFLSIGMAIVDGLLEGMGITSFSTGFKDFWEGLILWVKDIFGIHSPSTVFMEIGSNIILGFVNGLQEKFESVIQFFVNLANSIIGVWEEFKATVSARWEEFKSAVAEKLDALKTGIEEKWNLIRTKSEEIWTNIKTLIETKVEEFKTNVQNKVSEFRNTIETRWNEMRDTAEELWTNIKNKIEELVSTFKQNVENTIAEFKTNLQNKWTEIKNKATELWNTLKTNVEEKVTLLKTKVETLTTTLKTNLETTWTNLKTNTVTKFTQIKDKVIEAFEKLKEGIKAPINGALSIIESFVNTVIGGLNLFIDAINNVLSVASKLPSSVASQLGIEGMSLSLEHIPEISIPRLAQGAVIPPNKEFMAVLGDQRYGTNIEAPFDTIKQAFADVVGNMTVENTGMSVMEVDGQEFARLMVPYVISELGRRGYDVKILEA